MTNNRPSHSKYTYQGLLEAARELGDELGRSPTTQEAANDDRFPSIATIYKIADNGWLAILEDAGLKPTQVREYGSEEAPRICADLHRVLERVDTPYLTHRQYDDHGTYPTSVVKEYFGSWRNACNEAGISPGEKHGTHCEGPNGEILESRHEFGVASLLTNVGVDYRAHPKVEDTPWTADFYLPASDVWIEVDGYHEDSRPNKAGFAEKLDYLKQHNNTVLIVKNANELRIALKEYGITR
ncbi:homing endonuclease associated repeat-containing protein [Halobacterium wangiae]|uniref:homing endonuclease associated repeat-containing protein n=1 Tax=Halobacterium wangiae TaxID=2902623 RepID=UPI001E649636|nr:hypothetical protein [Halobacterium wangiae]